MEIDTSSRSVRKAWADRARAHREALVAGMRKARVDLVEVSTHGDVAEPIVRCFEMRARKGGAA